MKKKKYNKIIKIEKYTDNTKEKIENIIYWAFAGGVFSMLSILFAGRTLISFRDNEFIGKKIISSLSTVSFTTLSVLVINKIKKELISINKRVESLSNEAQKKYKKTKIKN